MIEKYIIVKKEKKMSIKVALNLISTVRRNYLFPFLSEIIFKINWYHYNEIQVTE